MSRDTNLFRPPKYAEPPKDMYYKVPETPQQDDNMPLPPIFPWEANAPKAKRVFRDQAASPSAQASPTMSPPRSEAAPTISTEQDHRSSPASPSTSVSSAGPSKTFQDYDRTNAWDKNPAIHHYIGSLPLYMRDRDTLTMHMHNSTQTPKPSFVDTKTEALISPPVPVDGSEPNPMDRPKVLKLTDFPTALERPSLPVTPAAIRSRSSFWGSERDGSSELPRATGVPEQDEWDPSERLEDLARRHSEALEKGKVLASSIGLGGPPVADQGGIDLPRRKQIPRASLPLGEGLVSPPEEQALLAAKKLEEEIAGDAEVAQGLTGAEVVPSALAADPTVVPDAGVAAGAATSAQGVGVAGTGLEPETISSASVTSATTAPASA